MLPYRILHSTTDRATNIRTVISVAGTPGQRIYQRERYQLRHDAPLLTEDTPPIERLWSTDGNNFHHPTEADALAHNENADTPQVL